MCSRTKIWTQAQPTAKPGSFLSPVPSSTLGSERWRDQFLRDGPTINDYIGQKPPYLTDPGEYAFPVTASFSGALYQTLGLESVIRIVAGGPRIRTRDAGVLGEQRKLKRSFALAVPPPLFPDIPEARSLAPYGPPAQGALPHLPDLKLKPLTPALPSTRPFYHTLPPSGGLYILFVCLSSLEYSSSMNVGVWGYFVYCCILNI